MPTIDLRFLVPFTNKLRAFIRERSGNVALIAGLAFPMLILSAGVALDYGSASSSADRVQDMADTAAIAGARELVLANAETSHIQSVAELSVQSNAGAGSVLSAITVKATADPKEGTVTVKVSGLHKNTFGGFLNPAQSPISAVSVARAHGGSKLCVLGLHPSANGAIKLENNAKITANACAVYSNSSHKHAIKTFHSSSITAGLICSVGGNDGLKGSFDPAPITDCPSVSDPLAARPHPAVSSCDENNLTISNQTITLSPGVYCGGLTIEGASDVTFESGEYFIVDGPLLINDTSKVQGEYTGFYFHGSAAELTIARNTTVELSAPKDGELAGLLFFQDAASAAKKSRFSILSNDARTLLGTIYLPAAEFYVDATAPIADKSAYTVIIADKFLLYAGPNLVLNTDYAKTDVPVPDGVLSKNAQISLIK